AQRLVGQPQTDPAVLALDPEPALLQIRQEPTTGPVVGVRNVVPHDRGLPRHLTDSSHDLLRSFACRRRSERRSISEKSIILAGKRRRFKPFRIKCPATTACAR